MSASDSDLRNEIDALSRKINAGAENLELSRFYYDRAGLYGLLAERTMAIHDYGKALSLAENACEHGKKYIAEIRSMMGLEFMLQGDKGLALFWTLSALDKDPDDAGWYFHFGLICSHVDCELFHVAIEAFRKAIEIRPDFEDAKLKLGECLREVYRIPESTDVLSKYVADHPDDPNGLYELGKTIELTLSRNDSVHRAKELYQKALHLNPPQELRNAIERTIRGTEIEP